MLAILPLEVMFALLEVAAEDGSKEQLKKVLKCLQVTFDSALGSELLASEGGMTVAGLGLLHALPEVRLLTLKQLKIKFIASGVDILVSLLFYYSSIKATATFMVLTT